MTTSKDKCYGSVKRIPGGHYAAAAVLLVLLALLLLPGRALPAQDAAPLILDAKSDTTDISLVRGQEVQIVLKENPSTGYTWNVLQQDPEKLVLVRKVFLPPEKTVPGAPGKARFVFKAIGSGSTTLELGYFRSWEGGQNAAEHFQLTIRIE